MEEQLKLRNSIVKTALNALTIDVDEQTVFDVKG